MSRQKQDHLGFLGGDGENEEESEIDEETEDEKKKKWLNFLGTWREEFDDLWTKLERREKSVIGGFAWHFEFCSFLQMDGHDLANKHR